jgi:hypothetical protein
VTERVSPEAYARVFEQHHEGVAILADLARRFYDVNVYVPGGLEAQRETERRAARREVIHFILTQIGQVGKADPNDEDPAL